MKNNLSWLYKTRSNGALVNGTLVNGTLAIVVAMLLTTTPVQADLINYGDYSGDTVQFQFVREISPGATGLFDSPTISGDQLTFGMSGFTSASGGGTVDFLNGQLRFTLQANSGYQIHSISFEEFGSYFEFGNASNSLASLVTSATIDGQLYTGSSLFDAQGGSGPWSEQFTMNVPAAQTVSLVLDSQLFTAADPMGAAFIDKQGLMITAGTSFVAVPEPSSMAMLGMAASSLVLVRRRRQQLR